MLIGQSRQAQIDNLFQRKFNQLNNIMQPIAINLYASIRTGNASDQARSQCTSPLNRTKSFTGGLVLDFDYRPTLTLLLYQRTDHGGYRLTCCRTGLRGQKWIRRCSLTCRRKICVADVNVAHRQGEHTTKCNQTCVQSLIAVLSARTFFIEQTEGKRPGSKSLDPGAVSVMNRLSGMYVISLSTTLIATAGAR
jgi:hypothetical protein